MNITLNNTKLSAVPGNFCLLKNFNTFGPFTDGRTYEEGMIGLPIRKGSRSIIGYWSKTVYANGNVDIKLSTYKQPSHRSKVA